MGTYDKIYKRQNNSCFYCKEKTDIHLMEKEHVYPKSKGGRGIKNKVLSCHFCNNLKSDLTISEFKIKVLNHEDASQDKLKNIITTLTNLENGMEIRKGWHKKALYVSDKVNVIPKKR